MKKSSDFDVLADVITTRSYSVLAMK